MIYPLEGRNLLLLHLPLQKRFSIHNLIVVKGDIRIVTTIRQIMTKFRRTLDVYQ